MANFLGAQQGLLSGFKIGQAAGGSKAGLGATIKKIADRLRERRETGEALGQQQNLLGTAGLIKGQIEPTTPGTEGGFDIPGMGRVKSIRAPVKWEPGTKQEAIEFKRIKQEKVPSWKQEQKVASIKTGLKRGEVTIGRDFGEPTVYPINSLDNALKAIADAGLDPSLFTKELNQFQEIVVKDRQGRQYTLPKQQLDEAIKQGYILVK